MKAAGGFTFFGDGPVFRRDFVKGRPEETVRQTLAGNLQCLDSDGLRSVRSRRGCAEKSLRKCWKYKHLMGGTRFGDIRLIGRLGLRAEEDGE